MASPSPSEFYWGFTAATIVKWTLGEHKSASTPHTEGSTQYGAPGNELGHSEKEIIPDWDFLAAVADWYLTFWAT